MGALVLMLSLLMGLFATLSGATVLGGVFLIAGLSSATLAIGTRATDRGTPWLNPGLVIILPSVVVAGVYSTTAATVDLPSYAALKTLEHTGFLLGALLAATSKASSPAPPADGPRILRRARFLLVLSGAACLGYFATSGIPVLQPNLEQGRLDVTGTGTGYLRLLAYLSVPAAVAAFAVKRREGSLYVLFSALIIALLANRSPFVYLLFPVGLILAQRPGRAARAQLLRVSLAATVVTVIVVSFGAFRIIRTADFRNYEEYRTALATHDVLKIGQVALTHYAATIGQNTTLTKHLVDSGRLQRQHGLTYLSPLTTALPGRQLTIDLKIKQASGASYLGGGTPPTLIGEGYVNFGYAGVPLGGALVSFLVFAQSRRTRNRSVPNDVTKLALYGMVASYASLVQVAGLVGASPVPPLLLLTAWALMRPSR